MAQGLIRERFGHPAVRVFSAVSGHGIEEWLDEVLSSSTAGQRIVEVDYDVYANGEAVLGWVNATFKLQSSSDWWGSALSRRLMDRLRASFAERAAAIGHVKAILTTPMGDCISNLTQTSGRATAIDEIEGACREGHLTINARVEMPPPDLKAVVLSAVRETTHPEIAAVVEDVHSLSPGRPVPSHRYSVVVGS
jgi:hypothetical protein